MRLATSLRLPVLGLLALFGALSCADAPTAPRDRAALLAPSGAASHAAPDVVISQVYGGGGNSGATYTHDFIELFNRSASPVSLAGWSVQYASATGTSWTVSSLSGTIQPGAYYLIRQAAGAGGTTALPTPDATGAGSGIAMGATAGKVWLSRSTAALSGACPTGDLVVDHVSYGTTASNCGSGTTATLSNTLAAIRNGNGCAFTGALGTDFTTGAPIPRNSASPTTTCSSGPVVARVSVTPATATILVAGTVDLTAAAFDAADAPVGASFTWTTSAAGTATVSSTGRVTGVAVGTATITATTPNGVNASATITVEAPRPLPPVRFSEIHYDNVGTDVNEAIEIEGPAGTDLTGWQVLLYNGNGGVVYHTTTLDAVIPSQCDGRGVVLVTYPTNGIQNGSPDGFALVDAAGEVVEFLSYEGTFTAADGPAAGMVSVDIGVLEETDTPLGRSLQRRPDGTWEGPVAAGMGFCYGSTAPPPSSISFSGRLTSEPPLPVGFEDQLFATLRTGFGEVVATTFTWTSETPAIASIDANGVMRSLAAGTAVLRATAADGTTATYALPTTVASAGTTAQYGNHTEFGDPVDGDPSDDLIIRRAQFTTSFNPLRGIPNWVSYNLDASHFGSQDRCDCFTYDPELPAAGRYTTADYTGAGAFHGYGIDRGHLVRSFDRTTGSLDNAVTYYFSNIIPQAADNNQGPWAVMETYLGNLARFSDREVYVIAGASGSRGTVKDEGRITIPEATWKVAVILPRDMGLADMRSHMDATVIAVIMPNVAGIRSVDWNTYRTTVDAVEALSGYDLLSALRDDIEIALESDTRPPVAALNGPWSAYAGDAVALSSAGSSDPDGDALTFAWDFGDGAGATGPTASHAWDAAGSYTVRLIATDIRGLADTVFSTATITALPADVGIARAKAGVADLVARGVLTAGQGNSLTVKLEQALRSLERGNVSAARGQLGAFLNELAALEQSGRVAPADAAPLRAVIERVLRGLAG